MTDTLNNIDLGIYLRRFHIGQCNLDISSRLPHFERCLKKLFFKHHLHYKQRKHYLWNVSLLVLYIFQVLFEERNRRMNRVGQGFQEQLVNNQFFPQRPGDRAVPPLLRRGPGKSNQHCSFESSICFKNRRLSIATIYLN